MRVRVPVSMTLAMMLPAAALLAGCASTVSGRPSAAPVASFPSSSTSAAQPGAQLITRVFAAMEAASAFHATATGTDDNGAPLAVDAHFGKDSSSGTIHEGGFTISVIVVPGAAYFKGDDAFWRNIIPASKQAQALPLFHGKWVTGPLSNPDMSSIADSFTRQSLVDSIRQGDPPSSYSIIGTGTRAGHQVTRLHSSVDDAEVDVLASGQPYPVYSSTPQGSSGGGSIVFDGWNVPFTAQRPPASEIFDASPYLH